MTYPGKTDVTAPMEYSTQTIVRCQQCGQMRDILTCLPPGPCDDCKAAPAEPPVAEPAMTRPSKTDYYLGIALAVAARGTCRRRCYGAVIVRDDQIVGTGYCGSPRGAPNCCDHPEVPCPRNQEALPQGYAYEACVSVHAEANALLAAGRERALGADLYVWGFDVETGRPLEKCGPCAQCTRLIQNAGIARVICGGAPAVDAIDAAQTTV